MKNAHLRMGEARFTKRVKDTHVDITVRMDRIIAEPPTAEREIARGHLLSVFGGDQEIGAVAAAVSEGAYFRVRGPSLEPMTVTLGKEAQCFRGSISVPGRNRPVRHLIAMSIELSETRPGGNPHARRTVLCENDPVFLLHRIAIRFGLPVLPEWSRWFSGEIERHRSIQPLLGLGCQPILVAGTKKRFLRWIGHALKRGLIEIPDQTRGISWPHSETFLERRIEENEGTRNFRVGQFGYPKQRLRGNAFE